MRCLLAASHFYFQNVCGFLGFFFFVRSLLYVNLQFLFFFSFLLLNFVNGSVLLSWHSYFYVNMSVNISFRNMHKRRVLYFIFIKFFIF